MLVEISSCVNRSLLCVSLIGRENSIKRSSTNSTLTRRTHNGHILKSVLPPMHSSHYQAIEVAGALIRRCIFPFLPLALGFPSSVSLLINGVPSHFGKMTPS